jgi:hypothetical protein
MYILEDSSNDRVYNIRWKWAANGFWRFYMASSWVVWSPWHNDTAISVYFDTTEDYCMSAIR